MYCSNSYHLSKLLNDLKPKYVVMYDTEVQYIRQIEVRTYVHITLCMYICMYVCMYVCNDRAHASPITL